LKETSLLFTDFHSIQGQSSNEAVHRDRVKMEKDCGKDQHPDDKAEKIERFIEKTRKLPGTITGFDDMLWNLLSKA